MRAPRFADRTRIWLRRHRRQFVVAVILGVLAGTAAIQPLARSLDRRGIDHLLPLRHWAYGPLFPPSQSDVVVVAIDEQTYHTEPFNNTPKAAWTPYLGFVIDAIGKAEPKAIGLDVVFPTTLDRPELLRGYDRPFLMALRRAADENRIVLGEVVLSGESQSPYAGQIMAVHGQNNVRLLNLNFDGDEVARTYVRTFANQGGGETPSFGVELAQRAGAAVPKEDFLINFNTGPGDIPAYSFVDLFACAQDGNDAYFREAFAGKIVLIGEMLDVEDRRVSAKRLIWDETATNKAAPARCKIQPDFTRFSPKVSRFSMPGVLIHAEAINTLTKGIALRPVATQTIWAMVAGATTILSLSFFSLAPISGAIIGSAAILLELVAAIVALKARYVAPAPSLFASAALAYTLVYAYRFVIEDREKRQVKHAFRHYLAPSLVEQLSENPDALKLGGERRWLTVMFTDIAGFTTISESLKETPEKLVELMNRYLTVMSGVVSRHEGYVDKFIGDAVMALWGAPLQSEQAERKAVETALDCQAALIDFNRNVVKDFLPGGKLGTRIGIATGFAIVGNMGSKERLNYTVTGDMVNLSARLEGANKEYGTSIMISELTAKSLGDGYILRRLDRLVVKGKTEPITVFEVVGRRGEVSEDVIARLAEFDSALALHDARDFAAALEIFTTLAPDDPPSDLYAERCSTYLIVPPPPEWQGEFALKTK